MVYRKKMLILTGSGKGIVLIEKSGLGVKFALRAFDVPTRGGLKAGVITKTAVFVRDLPDSKDPSAVFYVDGIDVDEVHFAVFDTRLLLYGTFGKRMWEANVMDLLTRHDRRPALPQRELPKLPPIAARPEVLPLTDGSGIVKKSDRLYGDEALAESDFYTPFALAERMPQIDRFLDAPRALAVERSAPSDTPYVMSQSATETTATADARDIETDGLRQSDNAPPRAEQADTPTLFEYSDAETDGELRGKYDVLSPQNGAPHMERADNAGADAAACACEEYKGSAAPWARTAEWLKSRARRSVRVKSESVAPPAAKTEIKRLRETEFFERVGKDVEKLFASAPEDGELAAILPDLRWIKVKMDGGSVSVGRNGDVFLCYAVSGSYEKASPFGDKAQWLPKRRDVPTGKGYWLIFQDLATGDILGGC
ncbi:MAG: hypothetical protein NC184_05975 [Roseburia sp.]|nr:hypothetical protein [Roseburia sp.]